MRPKRSQRSVLLSRALLAQATEATKEPLMQKRAFQDLATACGKLFTLYSDSFGSFSFKTIHCLQCPGEIQRGAKTRWENV